MNKVFLYLIVSFATLFGSDLLQLKNGKITNKKNQPVFLKGVNTGNWLMLEMWMLNYAGKGVEDQHEFIETLEHRFGKEKAEKLMDIYRSHWMKESDFDIIKSFGNNFSIFVNITNSDALTYKTTMSGTIFSVVSPILLIPPTITKPTNIANMNPYK